MKKIGVWVLWSFVLLSVCAPVGGVAGASSLPDQAQLTANRMLFEADTGEFTASGNVVIKADELTIRAPLGSGNVNSREVHFLDGVKAEGDWRGDWIDISAAKASFFFGQTPTYIAEGAVKGTVGKFFVDADKLYMKGQDFSALNVRRFEDFEMDVEFGAARVNGVVVNGVLSTFTATGNVWIIGRPNSGGEAVDIKGDRAVYSIDRGSVVVSGNVRAVQHGRTMTAGSLAYFPRVNRIDAFGAQGGQARIEIDMTMEQERRR